ncbi:MAG: 16S rRNA (cytosine967-C5)-methyltransferase [Bradymonadia bacterium]|jgi:16S rRNA (cytosine967-C5)-methyltransferase
MKSARRIAASVLGRVTDDGAFSQRVLDLALRKSELDVRDKGWVTATVNGVLSDLRAVDLALDRSLDRGISSLSDAPLAHLRIAAWEIGRLGREPGPVVSAAVTAVREDAPQRFVGLVNGVLRGLAIDRAIVFNPPTKATDVARFGIEYGLPDWLAERLLESSPDPIETMKAWNAAIPTTLRVRRGDRDALIAELTDAGIECAAHDLLPDAIVCVRGHAAGTDAHAKGRVAIHDAGAQLAIAALPPQANSLVDVCAGIGGKTLALADRYPNAEVAACDQTAKKLEVLSRALDTRAMKTAAWELGTGAPSPFGDDRFDIVVVDAPCSALGTIGRHPEVRWNRETEVVSEMAELQTRILSDAAQLVVDGGTLLFIVCTWTAEETGAQVEAFLAAHPNFVLTPPSAENADPNVDWSAVIDDDGTATLWPQSIAADGFFFARFTRTS